MNEHYRYTISISMHCVRTICPRSSDPFYIVSYSVNWVTTSWTYSTILIAIISDIFSYLDGSSVSYKLFYGGKLPYLNYVD